MKGIINCSSSPSLWTTRLFRGTDAFMLAFANKPLIEYYVDLAILAGVDSLLIILAETEEAKAVVSHFGNGELWDLKIEFVYSGVSLSVDDVVKGCHDFIGNEDMMLVSGYVFIDYDSGALYNDLCGIAGGSSLEDGEGNGLFVFRSGGHKTGKDVSCEQPDFGIRAVSSLQDYFDINMEILDGRLGRYILPGIEVQKDVISASGKLGEGMTGPLICGSDVKMGKQVMLGPWVVAGNTISIGQGARISRSVILDGADISMNAFVNESVVSPSGCYKLAEF